VTDALTERPDPTDTAARAALTTKPVDRPTAPARTPGQHLRAAWRRLTSMRTALQLLFLLALGAVPGSVLPQHGTNPAQVTSFKAAHPLLGKVFQRLWLFDVFAAPWFAAIYLLLFLSLIGCLVPRIRLHVKAMRTAPPAPPRHFGKLPRSTTWQSDESPAALVDRVRKALRRKGWRVVVRDEGLSAERGYLRETGNLVFHVSLVLLLGGVALGGLFGLKGEIIRTPGVGWSNLLGQYDEHSTGRAFNQAAMAPFTVTFDAFHAVYLPSGAPKSYDAEVTYTTKPGATPKSYDITENHPLALDGSWFTGGTKVYLSGHGYAPQLRITKPDGTSTVATQVFLPDETTDYLSEGYWKVTDGADPKGWFAIHGVFAPTPGRGSAGQLVSTYPAAQSPELQVNALSGDPSSESVYTVPPGMPSMKGADGQLSAGLHKVGDSWKLKNGYTVTFVGWQEFVNFQVTDDPGRELALVAAVLIVIGLLLSLRVRRRRLWVRARSIEGGRTVVEVGGLARSDPEQFAEEFADLTEQLRGAGAVPVPAEE
jgi:cytochrome c biogenesis protein